MVVYKTERRWHLSSAKSSMEIKRPTQSIHCFVYFYYVFVSVPDVSLSIYILLEIHDWYDYLYPHSHSFAFVLFHTLSLLVENESSPGLGLHPPASLYRPQGFLQTLRHYKKNMASKPSLTIQTVSCRKPPIPKGLLVKEHKIKKQTNMDNHAVG